MNNQQQQQTQTVGLGKAFGIFLSALVSIVMFVPRIIGSLNKAMDMADDLLDGGKEITSTMKESAQDFRTMSKLEADANHAARLKEINSLRTVNNLEEVQVNTSRQLSAEAQAQLAALKQK